MVTDIYSYVIDQGSDYWSKNPSIITNLALPRVNIVPTYQFVPIAWPSWAEDLMPAGHNWIWVETSHLKRTAGVPSWQQVDWLAYAFFLLNGVFERQVEAKQGAIHSYSFKLKHFPQELWQYAWVNRIFMFLRRCAARRHHTTEVELLGPMPKANIIITHDVDALAKTWAIRLKQTAFHSFNGIRALCQGRVGLALAKFGHAVKFFVTTPSYLVAFEQLLKLEAEQNVSSICLFHCEAKQSLKQWLLDPNYQFDATKYQQLRSYLNSSSRWQYGLHQGFDNWFDGTPMARAKTNLADIVKADINHCRQHWLRFSWQHTWAAQSSAKFTHDYTLGFNDRAGFRNSAALAFKPWDFATGKSYNVTSIPMILMDSHLYDYQQLTASKRHAMIKSLLAEVKFVGGTASVIWHPHTLSPDYGWAHGYELLLAELKDQQLLISHAKVHRSESELSIC